MFSVNNFPQKSMILVIFSLRKKSIKIIIARIFRALQKLTRLFIHFRLILVASAVNLKRDQWDFLK